MFDYLQQFNKLPKNLRDQVSSPSAMAAISELESKYRIDLAIVIMKVMVKIIPINNLPFYLSEEFSLSSETAQQLARDLKEKIFSPAADYLGLNREISAFNQDREIENIIKESGLVLPSSLAVNRFKNIIFTYNRGVRNKIDTKNTLAKSTKIGGLDLSPEEIDRVLKICDSRLPQNSVTSDSANFFAPSAAPLTRLDKIVASADSSKIGTEYNLKQAIAAGQIKKTAMPEKELNLPLAEKELSLPPSEKKLNLPLAEKELSLPLAETETAKDAPAPIKLPEAKVSEFKIPEIKNPEVKLPVPPIAPVKPVPPAPHISPVPPVPPVPPVSPVQPVQPVQPIQPAQPISPIKQVPPVPPKPVAASRPNQAPVNSKPVMHDIKPMPKVMGPLEELQFLDLLNFRRLGKTPAEITGKIFAKIKLLEAEGYDKMILGVRAWRQSPVNRLYLKMGQEAINKGMTIKEFSEISEKNNLNYLKLEEIEAIIILNSKLIF